ncbi:uncharacterized protein BJX67DRAFT_292923 [Aspergillus lucknowensis]|uniref:Uncharacterized protein n=1 Tax=Aspergillus lucknowensis TaxID=176173 RepID=A0ABR4LDV7_9EURO
MPQYNEVIRDGFTSVNGRFHTTLRQIERIDGASLRRMFLPRQTPEAKKYLRDYGDDFIRAQLKHYGVAFNEDEYEFSRKKTMLLKKALEAGKCDAVPAHILQLEEEMHREWLDTQDIEDLLFKPDLVMDKYFFRGVGKDRVPDRSRTRGAVGIPLPLGSEYRYGLMRDAAAKVPGLYQETARGPKTQTIYMGWDEEAVNMAVKRHSAMENKEIAAQKKERRAQERKRNSERAKLHKNYLQTLKKTTRQGKPSPVGSYIVDCEEIEKQWPDQADDLTLDIGETGMPDVFLATFDFGVLEGVMVIGPDQAKMDEYCSQADPDGYKSSSDGVGSGEDDEEEERRGGGSKRKAPAPPGGRGRPKKAKAGTKPSLVYQLMTRCRETGEGEIFSEAEPGTIRFKNGNLAEFSAEASLPWVGDAVPFTARKVSDTPSSGPEGWADYSEERPEYARVSRWH